MWKRTLALLLLIPLLDALFLVVVADVLGWQLTVLVVVLTALLGLVFVRAEGRRTLRRLVRSIRSGHPPTDPLIDGALLIAAGAFLLTPGLLTDAIGILFVLPITRYPIRIALKRWILRPYLDRKTGGFASGTVYTGGFPSTEPEVDPVDIEGGAYDVFDPEEDDPDVDT